MGLASKLTPFTPDVARFSEQRQFTAQLARRMSKLRHRPSLECGAYNYRLACDRNSAFMDSCQLIRKETKMEVVHLNQQQLAARWHLSEACRTPLR